MKIGERFTYPDFRLNPELVEATRKLYGKKASETIGWELAAEIMGMSSKSSSYIAKIMAMKQYGLIDGTETKGLVITQIGRQLAYGDPSEQQSALLQVIKRIPLWTQFYDKWTANGRVPPPDTFWDDLRAFTGIPPDDAKKLADKVRTAYLEDIVHLKSSQEVSKPSVENKSFDSSPPSSQEMEVYQLGKVKLWLPKDNPQAAWDKAKRAIDILLEGAS
jgi:hypothetical protein